MITSNDSMSQRERFLRLFTGQSVDRLPLYYFGTWPETKQRWREEGLPVTDLTGDAGPQLPEMDEDWEPGMWNGHGLVAPYAMGDGKVEVVAETATSRDVRDDLGGVTRVGKGGSTLPETIVHPLKPSAEAWRAFKRFLDPDDPRRRPTDWQARADELNTRSRAATFMAGSLYGWPRLWLSVEEQSYLPYDNPALFEQILEDLTDYFIAVYRPLLERVRFEFAYFWEDCCFNTGPMFSPEIYRRFYDKHYRRLIEFYRSMGVPLMLIDSDGKVDDLIPCWLDTGFDIIFPIEVGTWKADPVELRQRFGPGLKMMGGLDKHLISAGGDPLRREMERLKPLVEEGGFLPMPDHRISPECSLEAFREYLRLYRGTYELDS